MSTSKQTANLRRRVHRARNFPENTCPASRHLHTMAQALVAGKPYPMLQEEPEHCAISMLSVLQSLWKTRAALARLKAGADDMARAKTGHPQPGASGQHKKPSRVNEGDEEGPIGIVRKG